MCGVAMAVSTPVPDEVELRLDGVSFRVLIFPDPSGLRGQVFLGEEKIAGVQIFHETSREHLLARARRDRAVTRAVARLSATGAGTAGGAASGAAHARPADGPAGSPPVAGATVR